MNSSSIVCRSSILGCVAFLGLFSNQVLADNPGGWEYSVAPLYLWAKSIEGSSAIGGKEAALDLDFKDDILENLDSAFAIHLEARQGDLTLFAEHNYAKLDPSTRGSLGGISIEASVDFRDVMSELGIAYAFVDNGSVRAEVLGGVRYFDQEIEVKVGRTGVIAAPIPLESSGGDDWWHGFGGFRVVTKISQRWNFRARADFGYQDGNNKASHAFVSFDYRFKDWGSFFAGYRYLNTDYDNRESGSSGYATDTDSQGPLLGVTFHL